MKEKNENGSLTNFSFLCIESRTDMSWKVLDSAIVDNMR